MSFLDKILNRDNPNEVMQPLLDAIVAEGRQPHWYLDGAVPDTIDGRFDMIAAIFSMVTIRLEKEEALKQEIAWLTELFIRDMDGQMRQIGIGDMVVGKHVGKIFGALGGRIGAYRDALEGGADLEEALLRNVYRGEAPEAEALAHVTAHVRQFHHALVNSAASDIATGKLPFSKTAAQ